MVFASDQTLWANTLQRVGLAPAPLFRRKLTARKLAAAIREVAGSASMAAKAVEIARRMKGENGVARAVELIGGMPA